MGELLNALDDAGVWLAAVTAGLAALGWLAVRGIKAIRRIRRWAKDWAVRFAAVEDLVHHELLPNHGSSAKDTLGRLETRLTVVDGRSLMLAGMLAQRNQESRDYVEIVRATLGAHGIDIPTAPQANPPTPSLTDLETGGVPTDANPTDPPPL